MIDLLENEEIKGKLNYSLVDILRETKERIGGAWKYKINTTLKKMGYTFDNLPNSFTKEEIEKLQSDLGIEIETEAKAVLKEGADRKAAYELLKGKQIPKIVTYKQIHDMFGPVHEPYTEEFRKYYKLHREEFLENPEYIMEFGRIHNNFETIINSNELRNIYISGKLEISDIMGYLRNITFANQKERRRRISKISKFSRTNNNR